MSESSTPGPHAVWRSCVEAAMDGDVSAQTEYYHRDAVLEFPFLLAEGVPNRFEGREAIAGVFATLHTAVAGNRTQIDKDASSVTVLETADPEVLVAEIELFVRRDGEPEPLVNRYVQVVRVRDGKIVSMRDYFAGPVAGVVAGALGG